MRKALPVIFLPGAQGGGRHAEDCASEIDDLGACD
jgi:hypothetical protein